MSALAYNNESSRRTYIASSVILAAWLMLLVWTLSPYAIWLDHGHMGELEASLPVRLLIFATGWALMVIAMMLPGTLPLLARSTGIVPLLAGWVTVWLAFGAISYLADGLLHEVVQRVPALAKVIAPLLLLVAGLYQLTPRKRNHLARCRPEGMGSAQPDSAEQGSTSPRERWTMGIRHGVNCVGSCWALMLLMMAFGGMNLLGMFLLGVVMTAERVVHHGRTLTLALGYLLIAAAVVMTFITVVMPIMPPVGTPDGIHHLPHTH